MTAGAIDERASLVGELAGLADLFASYAVQQEACRDRVRPGTAVHHHHAHSVTLWRQAEGNIRARIHELLGDATG